MVFLYWHSRGLYIRSTSDSVRGSSMETEKSSMPDHASDNLFDHEAHVSAYPIPLDALHLVEALLFSATQPVGVATVADLLAEQNFLPAEVLDKIAYAKQVLEALHYHYQFRGVRLVEVSRGWQFRTAEEWAPALTRVIERPRRLSRPAMETLAIIAYHQPCTRAEIEQIRGVTLSQNILDALVEATLVTPKGHKEVPGRPVLWGTTENFLVRFGLKTLSDLPRREELLVDVPVTPTIEEDQMQSSDGNKEKAMQKGK